MDNSITHAMKDEVISKHLIQIAQRHCKLALEHGKANTSHERRKAIMDEIEALRIERDSLIKQFEN
jgi:hypothetical protein